MDTVSSVSLLDCLEDPERMDASLLKSVVTKHRAGFDAMPAPAELVPVDGVSPIAIKAMLEVARAEYDVVIIDTPPVWNARSEEHTSELQSPMRNSYADFCLKNQNTKNHQT